MSEQSAAPFSDPLGIIVAIVMAMIMVFWFGQGAAVNFIGGNSTIAANYCCASTSAYGATSWILWIVMSPFALLIFANHFFNAMRNDGDDGDISLENMTDNNDGGPTGLSELRGILRSRNNRKRGRVRYNPATHAMEEEANG